jgi:hypothetical protein
MRTPGETEVLEAYRTRVGFGLGQVPELGGGHPAKSDARPT